MKVSAFGLLLYGCGNMQVWSQLETYSELHRFQDCDTGESHEP